MTSLIKRTLSSHNFNPSLIKCYQLRQNIINFQLVGIRGFSVLTDEETEDENKPMKWRNKPPVRSIPVRFKILFGDQVMLMTGRDKGKIGRVFDFNELLCCYRIRGCLLRPYKDNAGEVKQVEETIHYSRLALIDPVYKTPCKVTLRFSPNNDLLRISKLSGAIIPWPDIELKTPTAYSSNWIDGPKDTPPEIALQSTFEYYEDKEKRHQMRQTMSKYNRYMISY